MLDAQACDELLQLVYAVKGGDRSSAVRAAMKELAERLVAAGAEAIILGCTEIPLVLDDQDVDVPLVASTKALAAKTVALARGEQALPAADEGSRRC